MAGSLLLLTQKRGSRWLDSLRHALRRLFERPSSHGRPQEDARIVALQDAGENKEEKNKKDIARIVNLAVEAAADGIAITDENNRILFMNGSFLKIHGHNPHARDLYIGADWRSLYNEVGQDHINSVVLPATILKGAWSGSMVVVRHDGSRFYGDASLTKLSDGLMLGVMRDVTVRRTAEIEQERLKDKLFHSQKMEAVGRITTKLVGEFQATLATIRKIADTHEAALPEDVVGHIRNVVARAQENVDEIMSFSQKRAARTAFLSIGNFFDSRKEEWNRLFPGHILLDFDIKSGEAKAVFDEGNLRQCIRNLLLNATDAIEGPAGRVVLTVRNMDRNLFGLRRHMITESTLDRDMSAAVRTVSAANGKMYALSGYLLRDGRYTEIIVSDTGRGISGEILPNIFDPFFTTKPAAKGTGLGLSTVHGYVTGGAGAVIVATMPGYGTDVHLYLPVPESGT